MYSVVLLMALTSGSEAVDFGRHAKGGCTGSCTGVVVSGGCTGTIVSGGCTGVAYGGCTGVAYGGCTGSCTGGHGHGLFSRLHNRHNGCNGGGCTGVIISGGCNGVISGGCTGGCGGVIIDGGVIMNPAPPVTTPAPVEKKVEIKKTTQAAAPATLVVTLPADARLLIDGRSTVSTTGERTFITPEFAVGQVVTYTLRAEIVRDGQTLTQTQVVNVRGGQTTAVPFSFNASGVASR
jgi:uncharacterized protein (TIGR03000 family)